MRRAMTLVVALPSSRRTRCRQASIPAAVPALVIRLPSSTKSTLRSTRAVGYCRDNSSACIQCVVQAGRPAVRRTRDEGARAHGQDDRSGIGGRPWSVERRAG